jgi:16S rRNA (cytosine1402-N4)-methyltransferase
MGVMFGHEPVMADECIDGLNLNKNAVVVDCTLGGGGHSLRILKRGAAKLIGIDRDETAIMAACSRLSEYAETFTAVHGNYADLPEILNNMGVDRIDGAIFDLGVSSMQLDTAGRGFSHSKIGPIDMRMDTRSKLTAGDIVNKYSRRDLEIILEKYGEERYFKRIADRIDRERLKKQIETTFELVEIIRMAVPKDLRDPNIHPAKRTFQALRIAANDELGHLERALPRVIERLQHGARVSVLSFHSLEDRIVKNVFKKLADPCECPTRDFPVCVCKKEKTVKIITPRPILPEKSEVERNPRSRSAKLRIAERL